MPQLLSEFKTALDGLDSALKQFKERPMYKEWLDPDEINVMSCVCGEDDCLECIYIEDEELDLIEFEDSFNWLKDNL